MWNTSITMACRTCNYTQQEADNLPAHENLVPDKCEKDLCEAAKGGENGLCGEIKDNPVVPLGTCTTSPGLAHFFPWESGSLFRELLCAGLKTGAATDNCFGELWRTGRAEISSFSEITATPPADLTLSTSAWGGCKHMFIQRIRQKDNSARDNNYEIRIK